MVVVVVSCSQLSKVIATKSIEAAFGKNKAVAVASSHSIRGELKCDILGSRLISVNTQPQLALTIRSPSENRIPFILAQYQSKRMVCTGRERLDCL